MKRNRSLLFLSLSLVVLVELNEKRKIDFQHVFITSIRQTNASVHLFQHDKQKAFAVLVTKNDILANVLTHQIIMGCKQTTTANPETPPVMIKSPTLGTTTFVKSALRKPNPNGRGKTEKLSTVKRNPSVLNRSVNFDEKVQVKLRTPTPRESTYQTNPTVVFRQRRRTRSTSVSDTDQDEFDQEVTSISSDDDQQQQSSQSSFHRRNSSANGIWHKTNSVGVIKTKSPVPVPVPVASPQIVTVTRSIYPPDSNSIPTGKRFKVRRKISDENNPILSPTSIPVESSSVTTTLTSPHPPRSPTVKGNPTYYAFANRTRETRK